MLYHGKCHCGAVEIEVSAPERITLRRMQLFDMFEIGISTPDRTEIEIQIGKGRERADNVYLQHRHSET